jgi:hypothetical protein
MKTPPAPMSLVTPVVRCSFPSASFQVHFTEDWSANLLNVLRSLVTQFFPDESYSKAGESKLLYQ